MKKKVLMILKKRKHVSYYTLPDLGLHYILGLLQGIYRNYIHISKYLKEHLIIFHIGDNVNPYPIDKPYIPLDNKIETQFILLFLKDSHSIETIKQSLLKFMAKKCRNF